MASQDARLSKFEADFKQQQGEMANKIETILKAINDRITGALPSDSVKNPKLNVNSTSLVLSTFLAHALMYNAMLDKYMESLDLRKNRHGQRPATSLLIGRGFLATTNAIIESRNAKIAVGEGVTRSIFRVKEIDLGVEEVPYWTTLGKQESHTPRPSTDRIGARPPYYAKKDFTSYHLPDEWEIARDAKLNHLRMS
ncbi:hypothetical protein Tco_0194053 [Tanacetum coccineum]